MSGLTSTLTMDPEMAEFLLQTRNAVRAVILRGETLLVQRKVYEGGRVRFTLPGGAPEVGETLEEGLRRECREEIGAEIEVQQLMHVADYYKQRETVPVTVRHQVEFFFRCRIPSDYVATNGSKPDKHQQDVIWLPLNSESKERLFPKSLQQILQQGVAGSPIYLGLID